MTEQWTVPAWVVLTGVAVVAVLALLVALCLLQVRRVARRAEARTAALSHEVADLAAAAAAATAAAAQRPGPRELAADHPSYVITRLGDEAELAAAVEPVATLPPGAFADVVLREGALRSASLLHGVRRALAPETRSRIRAEMRREVKRQRKTRRLETREALRAWQARQREQEPAA